MASSSGPSGWIAGPAALLAVTHFAAHADRALLSIAAPAVKAELALSDAQLGLLLGPAFSLAFVVGALLVGRWVDRTALYRLIAAGLVLWTLATAACGLATSIEGLFTARVVLGLGQAALAPAALSLLLFHAAPARGGRAVAAFTSGAALGRSCALLIGGLLLSAIAVASVPGGMESWRLLFLVSTVPNILLAVALLRRKEPARAKGRPADGGGWAWMRARPAAFLAHLAVASTAVILTQAVGAWGPSLLGRELGLTPSRAALLAGVAVLVAAPAGHLLGGGLVDRSRRLHRPPTRVVAAAFAAVVPCALILAFASSAATLIAGFFLLTMTVGMTAVAALAAFQALAPGRMRGSVNAGYFAVVTLVGLGLGPPLVGLANDARLGLGGAGLAAATAGVVAVLAVPAALASWSSGRLWARTASEAAASEAALEPQE